MNFIIYLVCAIVMLSLASFPSRWWVLRFVDMEEFEPVWKRKHAVSAWYAISVYLGAVLFAFTLAWNLWLHGPELFETVYAFRADLVKRVVLSGVFGVIATCTSIAYHAHAIEESEE